MEVERRVGVDLGLRGQHQAVVYDGVVRQGRAFAVKVSREGFDELLRRATEGSEGPVTFVMEPTGNAWVTLAAYVAAAGHRVKLAKPQKVSDLRKFYRKHTKTDVIDAEALARLPEVDADGVRDLAVPTAKQMSLRRLVPKQAKGVQRSVRFLFAPRLVFLWKKYSLGDRRSLPFAFVFCVCLPPF